MENDIIVALSTPRGKNGIGVIRLSGAGCLNLAKKMFKPYNKNANFMPNLLTLGKVDMGRIFDTCFLVYFKSPKSYTGEDCVEFQCHGGLAITDKIIERAISFGARLAEPGEFSKRAFLNGKLSLDEAEGVIDIINAESESELRASSNLGRGMLHQKIISLQNSLTDLLAEIEVNLDYPEHDIEYKTKEKIKEELESIGNEINALLQTSINGKKIRYGVNVAIVGKTNVGKSSLLNSITGENTAIVTEIEGTTRDVVTSQVEFKGVKFNFYDTAGIRKTSDVVEKLGIEKAKEAMLSSDLVLLVFDANDCLSLSDIENINLIKEKQKLFVLNKSDLIDSSDLNFENLPINKQFNEAKINLNSENCIFVSAKENKNIDKLKEKIYDLTIDKNLASDELVLTNIRHVNILKIAHKKIEEIAKNALTLPLDCLSLDIHEIWGKLGEITGQTASEDIVDKIFSKFCLGK